MKTKYDKHIYNLGKINSSRAEIILFISSEKTAAPYTYTKLEPCTKGGKEYFFWFFLLTKDFELTGLREE